MHREQDETVYPDTKDEVTAVVVPGALGKQP
jgi:hypothetical protein